MACARAYSVQFGGFDPIIYAYLVFNRVHFVMVDTWLVKQGWPSVATVELEMMKNVNMLLETVVVWV